MSGAFLILAIGLAILAYGLFKIHRYVRLAVVLERLVHYAVQAAALLASLTWVACFVSLTLENLK